MEIRIDVTDWEEEYQESALSVVNDADLIELSKCAHPAKLGRLAIVAREIGEAELDVLPANKLLLNLGAAEHISSVNRIQRLEENQAVPAFVGPLTNSAERIVPVEEEEALTRAEAYLRGPLMGHLRGRLEIIRYHGGDVMAAAQRVKSLVDQVVDEMLKEVEAA